VPILLAKSVTIANRFSTVDSSDVNIVVWQDKSLISQSLPCSFMAHITTSNLPLRRVASRSVATESALVMDFPRQPPGWLLFAKLRTIILAWF
jgi:hypothetical protein